MASNADVKRALESGLLLERSSLLLDPIRDGIVNGELASVKYAEDAADVVIALIWTQLLIDPNELDAHFAKRAVDAALGDK
jgi:hypothetical protein